MRRATTKVSKWLVGLPVSKFHLMRTVVMMKRRKKMSERKKKEELMMMKIWKRLLCT